MAFFGLKLFHQHQEEEKGSENGSNSPEGNNSDAHNLNLIYFCLLAVYTIKICFDIQYIIGHGLIAQKLELFQEDGAVVKEVSSEEIST